MGVMNYELTAIDKEKRFWRKIILKRSHSEEELLVVELAHIPYHFVDKRLNLIRISFLLQTVRHGIKSKQLHTTNKPRCFKTSFFFLFFFFTINICLTWLQFHETNV